MGQRETGTLERDGFHRILMDCTEASASSTSNFHIMIPGCFDDDVTFLELDFVSLKRNQAFSNEVQNRLGHC
jgi:hypothetical protein